MHGDLRDPGVVDGLPNAADVFVRSIHSYRSLPAASLTTVRANLHSTTEEQP